MKASREDLVKLFSELGVKDPGAWPKSRMVAKIEQLAKASAEDRVTETKEAKKLLDELLEALENEKDIELTGYEETASAEGGEKKSADKKEKKPKVEKEKKGPGVIASIVEFLQKATEKKPITKEEMADKLAARFPDRSRDSMMRTINVQVPNRLKVDKKLDVQKNDKGYFIKA